MSILNWYYVEITENGISVYSFPFRIQPRQDFVEQFESFYSRERHVTRYGYVYDVVGETCNSKVILMIDLEKKEAQEVVDFLNENYGNFSQ